MAGEYTLSYTAEQINERLGKAGNAVLFTSQTLTDEQKAQARDNIGAVSSVDFAAIATIGTNPENVLGISEDNYYNLSPDLSAPTVVFHGDGFDFTRGQDGNYSIAFAFPTEIGKSYDLSFNFESGTMHKGRVAKNGYYPDPPQLPPSSGVVEFSTNIGQHNYTFTATGQEMLLYFAVYYNSPKFKISGVSCVLSGSSASGTRIKEAALPDSLVENIAVQQDRINAIAEYPNSILKLSESNFYNLSPDLSAPTVVFHGDGFDFTRGQFGNYSIAFVFPTEIGKSYDLSFNFESGTMHKGRVAKNGYYPDPPQLPPSSGVVEFSTNIGQHNYTFTATGQEMLLYFAVYYDSPLFKVRGVSCVASGTASSPKIREEALPDSFNNIVANKMAIGERLAFVDNVSDFTATATAIRTDGVMVAKNRRPSTGYIDLKGCTSIYFGLNQYRESASEVYNVVSFFDADKVYISGLPSASNGYLESVIIVPENAAYVVGSWFDGLTDTPYMIGVYDASITEKINTARMADRLNADRATEIVNPSMTMAEFAAAMNGQWETYAALCKCVPWCFMPIQYTDSSGKYVPFADICEVINKNFRTEVASPDFSFAENCNRINNAFMKPIYRFADAKLNTKDTSNFVANMKDIVDFSLDTGMAKVEPSVIVSDDGNTMYIYAYNHRISTTDGVNWTAPTPLAISGHSGLIHVNVNYIDGVFYLFGCDKNKDGTFGMMISADGTNFTYQGVVFPESHQFTSGKPVKQWGNSCIVKEYGSNTYYMYVEYRTDMNSGWEIGVVTATNLTAANADGTIGNWQNVTSDPILSALWMDLDRTSSVGAGNPDFAKGEDNRPVKVNGRYFMYVHSTHHNKTNISGLTSFSSGQSNILRLSSANLIDWDVDGLMFDNRDIPEEDNPETAKATSGNADHCIIQFKGRTYLFYSWNINHQTSGRAEYVHYMIDDRPIREILAIRP